MPTSPAAAASYDALRDCARRRIEEEWDVTGREQTVLRAIEVLSFGCQQMKMCLPKQALLAQACGMQRSEVCRVLGRLVRKGALSRAQHRDETLYALELHCASVPRRTAVTAEERNAAMEALIEIQENRRGGEADASGQLRLQGVLGPAEDLHVEADAFAAMTEQAAPRVQSTAASVPRSGPAVERSPDVPTPEEVQEQLRMLRSRFGQEEAADPRALQVERYRHGLSSEQQYLWDRLVREMLRGQTQPEAWADFVQWAPKWRRRVQDEFQALHEAVADHQLLNTPADFPGKWILSVMQRMQV